jgi:hypothetical protein
MLEETGEVFVVSVKKRHQRGPAFVYTPVSSCTRPCVLLSEKSDARITILLNDARPVVCRTIVNHHDFEILE